MLRMHCLCVLVQLGCVITRMAFCNFGSGFNKPSQWLHNKGWLLQFEKGPVLVNGKINALTLKALEHELPLQNSNRGAFQMQWLSMAAILWLVSQWPAIRRNIRFR